MSILSLAKQRYATKAYDDTHTIDDTVFEQILQIARLSPSSVNSQPWHFIVAKSSAAKARVAKSMQADTFSYNAAKVQSASHVIVLATLTQMSDEHLGKITDAEMQAGRYTDRTKGSAPRLGYVQMYQAQGVVQEWLVNQTHIALGQLLLGAASLGVDATPIGGFDNALLDTELKLAERGLASTVVITLGKRSADDSNASLPKARLPMQQVVSYLE